MESNSYVEVMRDSTMRKEAVSFLIARIEEKSNRVFNEKEIRLFTEVLQDYEIEDGVSVFMAISKPEGKEKIAKIRCHNEYVTLWWGTNRNAKKLSHPNRFALGITFEDIPATEHTYLTIAELSKKFPTFKDFFETLHPSDEFMLFAYSKAGFLAKAVMNREGTWLLQTPEGKSFVPSAPIGKKVGNELHIFWPGNTIRREFFKRLIQVV